MLESGDQGMDQHKEIEELLISSGVPYYLVGHSFAAVSDRGFDHVDSLKAHLADQGAIKNRTILLKASRGIALERLLDLL